MDSKVDKSKVFIASISALRIGSKAAKSERSSVKYLTRSLKWSNHSNHRSAVDHVSWAVCVVPAWSPPPEAP